jgi:4-diphosphocytidyl-2-C-methyl-D-erythritol kinase
MIQAMRLASLNNCPAPAKLNLFLHVNGRRLDGYHQLQTVFQLIERGDSLHFQLRADHLICRSTILAGVPEADDLVVRAARLLQAEAVRLRGVLPPGVDIAIDKRLVMGGGLGGGSSDAATTLMALNHLWQVGLTREQLMALGLPLGADIPFFIFGETAFAEGIGEDLQAVCVPEYWYVVIEPGISVPTPQIFCAEDLTRDTAPVIITDFSSHMAKQNGPVAMFGKNDLQQVASRLYPQVGAAVQWLSEYGDARMTGSGACVFCGFSGEDEADAVISKIPAIWTGWKAKALSHHPLLKML